MLLTTPSLLLATLLTTTLASPSPLLARSSSSSSSSTCATCDPSPGQNKCDVTTSCITVTAHTGDTAAPNYCACRAGYRATDEDAGDSSAQWRLPWADQQGRVFVRPGVVCDTLCDQWQLGPDGCTEVEQLDGCL